MFAAWMLSAALLAPSAEERELDRVGVVVNSLGIKLKQLVDEYKTTDPTGLRRFPDRLADAEILFLLNDFSRASLVLFDLVEDAANRDEPRYARAVYYLAESLYQIGHDASAQQRFEDLVRRGDAEFLKPAVRRLIQIADRRQEWAGMGEAVAVLAKAGPLPPDIAYIDAKSLLRQGKFEEAITAAGLVPADEYISGKARYIAAVAYLQRGDLDRARDLFTELTKIGDTFADAATIRELAAMNRGRILLEQGKFGESVDAYQFVPRNSSNFDEALYEVTWNYVRSADSKTTDEERRVEFVKARNALEILLLAGDDTPLAPEARLLLGNILIRLTAFPDAGAAFDEVVSRYAPVRDQLHQIASTQLDPDVYLQEISGQTTAAGLLPPLARRWATGQERLQEAMGVSKGLDAGETMLDEADKIAGKLLAILDSERRLSFFPALRDAQGRTFEIRNSLTSLSENLLAIERVLVRDHLSAAQVEELKRVLAERAEIEPLVRALPEKKADYEQRADDMVTRLSGVEQQAFRLKYNIQSMQAQLNALKVWIRSQGEALSEDAQKEYAGRIAQEERVISELESGQAAIAEELAREKSMISVSTPADAQESELRARYAISLEREREILVSGEAAVDPTVLGKLEQHRATLGGYHVELSTFEKRLNELVRRKSVDLKAEVLREQGLLQAHRAGVAAVRGEAKQAVGEIAQTSLADMQKKFEDIVLRADVGIVDVAWARKEEKTHEISRRVNEEHHELKVLDDEFAEVMSEE